MLQTEIHQYLRTFFIENNCEIVEDQIGYMTVQLNVEMDKALMNRPFYWTYIEKTGGIAAPMKITFVTDSEQTPDNIKGEKIYFGAPRLHQLFETTKELTRYIRLYEVPKQANHHKQIPLHPWLILNLKISYKCDRKKEVIRSLGLNLINGTLVDKAFDELDKVVLQAKIPDYCFTVSPIIKPESGVNRIQTFLSNEIQREDHQWAQDAKQRWETDLQLLDHFYEEHEEKPETYDTEKEALKDQYEPIIHIEVINGGIFYLSA